MVISQAGLELSRNSPSRAFGLLWFFHIQISFAQVMLFCIRVGGQNPVNNELSIHFISFTEFPWRSLSNKIPRWGNKDSCILRFPGQKYHLLLLIILNTCHIHCTMFSMSCTLSHLILQCHKGDNIWIRKLKSSKIKELSRSHKTNKQENQDLNPVQWLSKLCLPSMLPVPRSVLPLHTLSETHHSHASASWDSCSIS